MGYGESRRWRDMVATVAAIGIPMAAIRLLHVLGTDARMNLDLSDPLSWLDRAQPLDALSAVLRLGGLILGYYVLITTVAYLVAVSSGNRRLIGAIEPLALPFVRSLADRLIAGTIAVSALATPLLGATPTVDDAPSPSDITANAIDADYVPTRYRTLEAQPTATPAEDATGTRSAASRSASESAAAFRGRPTTSIPDPPSDRTAAPTTTPVSEPVAIVKPGESLWSIAEDVVGQSLGRPPLDHEISPYWRRLVDHNRVALRSGDPDLIYPGEEIELPAP